MNNIRKAAATAAAVIGLTACASAGSILTGGTPPAVAQVTVTQCGTGTPACAAWQDTNATGTVQDLELLDHNGSPIWWVNNAGGMWVGNDKLGVTGASVFDQAIYMYSPDGTHGALVIDGQVFTAADIQYLRQIEQAHLTIRDVRWLASFAHAHGG